MKKTFIIGFVCFVIDRIIKLFIINSMFLGQSISVLDNFFNITYVANEGAAFSILSNQTLLLILLSFIVLVLLVFYVIKNNLNKLECLSYGILIGGITGNLFDRLFYSKVIDYLDFNIFGYKFPIFNFADICIVISIFLIVVQMIRSEKS